MRRREDIYNIYLTSNPVTSYLICGESVTLATICCVSKYGLLIPLRTRREVQMTSLLLPPTIMK